MGKLLVQGHLLVSSTCLVVKQIPTKKATVAKKFGSSTSKIDLWDQRLTHIYGQQLFQRVKSSKGVDLGLQGSLSFCEAYVQDKCYQKSHHSTRRGKSKENN